MSLLIITSKSIIMKSLFSLCFILFFLCTNSAAKHHAVLDIDGDEVTVGSTYNVVPATQGAGGGGLALSSYPGLLCPTTVSQERDDFMYGMPLRFHPADSNETTIHHSKSLNIKFEIILPCADSTVWKVSKLIDPYTRSRLIELGGMQGNPGCDTKDSWFKIEKGSFKGAYKFVSSPNAVCDTVDESESYALIAAQVNPKKMPLVQSFNEKALELKFVKYDPSDDVKEGYRAKPYIAMYT